MSHKRNAVVILLVLFVFSMSSVAFCQEDGPSKTVRSFYQCVQKGDLDSIMLIMTENIVTQISKAKELEGIGQDLGSAVMLAGMVNQKQAKVTFKNLTLNPLSVADKAATVQATYQATVTVNGKSETQNGKDIIYLKPVKGYWMIYKLVDKAKN
jgi:ketosteroid isomerase-like protein